MPAFEAIASTTLGSTSSTVTFSSIPGTYEHLQVRVFGQRNTGAVGDLAIRFNGSSAGYTTHLVQGNGSTAAVTAQINQSSSRFGYMAPNTTSTRFGVAICDILDYANEFKYKTIRSISGYDYNGETTDPGLVALHSGLWLNASPITSIDIVGMTFSIGSVFSLYGLRSA